MFDKYNLEDSEEEEKEDGETFITN